MSVLAAVRRDRARNGWRSRRGAVALNVAALAAVLIVMGCGGGGDGDGDGDGDGSSAVASSTTAPVAGPAPQDGGGADVESASIADLDLCESMGDAPAAAFLDALGLGPIDEVQGKTAEGAAVCGWFVAPDGDAMPEGVLVRVEPQSSEGNEVCRAGPEADVAELSAGDGTGWVGEADGRVQAAVLTGTWCAYVRGPAGATPGPATATEASAALLSDTLAVLATSE